MFAPKGKEKYLSVVRKYVDIHGTVFVNQSTTSSSLLAPSSSSAAAAAAATAAPAVRLPSFVVNHGLLPPQELHQLMAESKV